MPDGAKKTMTDKNKAETTKAEEQVDVETEETTGSDESETSSDGSKSEEKDEESSHNDSEIDYDAEIAIERKGKPDPEKAKKAFKTREQRRQETQGDEGDEEESDEDRPLTQRELNVILENDRKERRALDAFQIARALAGSDKEAELIVEKWKNRTFPEHLSLTEQIEESFAITHRKRLIGQKNEALRALKNKGNVNSDAASTHRDAPQPSGVKMSPNDLRAITRSGFVLNNKTRLFEKKLGNGDMLIHDPKTGVNRYVKKNQQ